jgi:hypothetical protein
MRQYMNIAAQLSIKWSNFELEDLWASCVSGTNNHLNPPEPVKLVALANVTLFLDPHIRIGATNFTTHCCATFLDSCGTVKATAQSSKLG